MRGSRSGSPVTAGCPSTRHRSGAPLPRPTAPPRPASTPATPRTAFGGADQGRNGGGADQLRLLAQKEKLAEQARRAGGQATTAVAPVAARPARARCRRRTRSGQACAARSRYLTPDPRRLAGAARRELVDFLADQGIAVRASATPDELHSSCGSELGADGRAFAAALARRASGPRASAAAATGARRSSAPPARRPPRTRPHRPPPRSRRAPLAARVNPRSW